MNDQTDLIDEDDEFFEDEESSPEMQAKWAHLDALRRELWACETPEVIMDYGVQMIPYNAHKKDFVSLTTNEVRTGREVIYRLDAVRVGTVGNPLILFQKYAVEQIWFPFVDAVLASEPPTKEEREFAIIEAKRSILRKAEEALGLMRRDQWGSNLHERAEMPMRVDRDYEQMYHFDSDWMRFQHVLPFKEFQKVEHLHHSVTRSWDQRPKDKDGKAQLLTITIQPSDRVAVENWLAENTTGRYHWGTRDGLTLTMEKYREWMYTRLQFDKGQP